MCINTYTRISIHTHIHIYITSYIIFEETVRLIFSHTHQHTHTHTKPPSHPYTCTHTHTHTQCVEVKDDQINESEFELNKMESRQVQGKKRKKVKKRQSDPL